MASETVSLIIEGKDKASDVISGIGGAITGINQGLEIAKKAFETFNKVVLQNFKAMVEYRGENDRVTQELKAMGNEALWLKAQVFDVLTPVVLGLGDALSETSNGVMDYINANRQLIATNITTFLADTARILISGVAEGLLWVSRAVSGLIEVWNLLSAGIEAATSAMLSGISSMLSAVSEVVEITGGPAGLSDALANAAKGAQDLGAEFSKSSGESLEAVNDQIAKQQEFEDSLRKFKTVAVDFVGEAEIAVLKRIEAGWDAVKKKPGEMTAAEQAALDQRLANIDSFSAARIARLEEQAQLEESILIAQSNKAMEEQGRIRDFAMNSAETVGAAIGATMAAMAAGAITAEEALANLAGTMVDTMISAIETVVVAEAAKAAAGAASGMFSIPIVGPALAAGAAASAFAFVKGLMSLIPKAADGGQVFGGVPGQDSVGTLVQHGEGVLKQGQTAVIQRLANALDGMDKRNVLAGAMGGGGETYVTNFNSVAPATSADAMQAQRAMMRQQDRAKRLRRK